MTQTDKLIAAMRANPRGWTISDVERICRQADLIFISPKRGSHFKIACPGLGMVQTIPYNRPIKPIYIRNLMGLLDLLDNAP